MYTKKLIILLSLFISIILCPKANSNTEQININNLIKIALSSSYDFHLIIEELKSIESKKMQYQIPFDGNFQSKFATESDRLQLIKEIRSSQTIRKNSLELSYKKNFQTGTQIRSTIDLTSNDKSLLNGFTQQYDMSTAFNSRASFSVTQQLYKNYLGQQYRHDLKATEKSAEALYYSVLAKSEDWLMNIIEIYYRVWLQQAQLKLAKKRLLIQNRLLKSTKIKLKLGTADQSDLLQVSSAVISSEQDVLNAEQTLREIWNEVVYGLNLDTSWLNVELDKFDIQVDPISTDSKTCDNNNTETSSKIEEIKLRKESLKHSILSLKDAQRPDIYLELSTLSNANMRSLSDSMLDTLTITNPKLNISIGISFPTNSFKERSQEIELFKSKLQQDLLLKKELMNQSVTQLNLCQSLNRSKVSLVALNKIKEQNDLRNKLDEQKFKLGKIDLFNVIQSSNELLNIESKIRNVEANIYKTIWKMRKVNNKLKNYITQNIGSQGFK